jgi:hypothetical protein
MAFADDSVNESKLSNTDSRDILWCESDVSLPSSNVRAANLVANGKPDRGVVARWFGVSGHVRNVARHFTLDRCQKRIDLAAFSFDHKLDSAIGCVADVARNTVTSSQRLACGAKPHTLNPAREKYPPANPRHETSPRAGGDAATVKTNKDRWQTTAAFPQQW